MQGGVESLGMAVSALRVSDPTMHFRLDPGEPGLLRSAPASQATLRVTAQEQRNLARLESEARMSGRVIIQSGTHYGREFAGGYLTTASGLTTVISREPRPSVIESETARDGRPERPAGVLSRGPAMPGEPAGDAPAADVTGSPEQPAPSSAADRELASEEARLSAELRRLETPGFQLPSESGETGVQEDPLRPLAEAADGRRAEADRQTQAREVESDLRRVRAERLLQELGRSMAGAASPASPAPATV